MRLVCVGMSGVCISGIQIRILIRVQKVTISNMGIGPNGGKVPHNCALFAIDYFACNALTVRVYLETFIFKHLRI